MRWILLAALMAALPAAAQDAATPTGLDPIRCAATAATLERIQDALPEDARGAALAGAAERAGSDLRAFALVAAEESECSLSQAEASEQLTAEAELRAAEANDRITDGEDVADVTAILLDDLEACSLLYTEPRLDRLRRAAEDGDVPCGWTFD